MTHPPKDKRNITKTESEALRRSFFDGLETPVSAMSLEDCRFFLTIVDQDHNKERRVATKWELCKKLGLVALQ